MYKPNPSFIVKDMEYEGVVHVARRGQQDGSAQHRLFLLAGTHGNEIAGPMALATLLEREWEWPNVQMLAVLQDEEGYLDEGYGFVSSTEEDDEACWPPLWHHYRDNQRYWFYVDENSAWGNNAVVPKRHRKMRELMHDLEPTFMLTLHETVQEETTRNEFWAGAGNLLIEVWPISSAELSSVIRYEGNPLSDPIGWMIKTSFEFIRGMFGIPRWKLSTRALQSNPHYQLTTKIVERYIELGGEIAGGKWTEYLEYFQDLVIGAGRLVHSPEYHLSEWRTATDYACGHFGCPGVTTETFQPAEMGLRGVDDRVANQCRYIQAVLDTLEGIDNEQE